MRLGLGGLAVNPIVAPSGGFASLSDPAFPTLAGGYTPLAHYKAHKLSGEGSVETWEDEGNTHDLSQATADNQPQAVADIVGGYPVVRFDGTDDYMFNDSLASLSSGSNKEIWIFAVVVPRGWTSGDVFWSFDDGAGVERCGIRQVTSTPQVEGFVSAGGTDVALALDSAHLIIHKCEFAQAYLKIDGGAQQANQNQGSDTSMENLYMGSAPGPDHYAQVDIAEYIMLDIPSTENLSDADRLLIETYLDDKYSLGFVS